MRMYWSARCRCGNLTKLFNETLLPLARSLTCDSLARSLSLALPLAQCERARTSKHIQIERAFCIFRIHIMYCARVYVCVCVCGEHMRQSRGILRSNCDVDAAFKCATFFYVAAAAAAAAFAWLPSAHTHTCREGDTY